MNTSLPAVMAVVPPASDALPGGGSVPTGYGSVGDFDYSITGELHVRDVAEKTVINWDNFDIGSDALTEFHQLGVNPAVLNRITSGEATGIFGSLQANGRVFIVNPAGIVFGANSTVNVTQLVASTLNITDENFWNGKYEFAGDIEDVEVLERLGVVNNSDDLHAIHAAEGVALIGRKILNAGTITTDEGGFVVMAAGDRVLLGNPGSKIVVEMDSVTLADPENPEGFGNVVNEGAITAPGGTVVLAAGDIFSVPLHPQLRVNSGTVEEPIYVVADQPVRVESGIGTVTQSGIINTDSIDGGSVVLTAGDEVILTDGSLTSANGGISNAGANGGEVIAYASELYEDNAIVDFQDGAKIEVKGGSPSDPTTVDTEAATFEGGLVELSGDHLFFDGAVDATATPFDIPDPENPGEFITIKPEGGTLHIDPVILTLADGGIPDDGAARDTFYEQELEAYSQAGVNTILEADYDITVENITDGVIEGGSGDIVLRTIYNTGSIEFLPDTEGDPITTIVHTTGGGDIFMLAGSGGIVTGELITEENNGGNPGRIRIFTNNGGAIETGALLVDGGNDVEVSIIASGDLAINGDVITETNKVPANYDKTGTAYICLVSENGSVDILGAVEVEAHGKDETVAQIHICADNTVSVYTGNGRVQAISKTSSAGSADAQIRIHAGSEEEGAITVIRDGGDPIRVQANTSGASIGPIDFTGDDVEYEQTNSGSHVFVQIAEAWLGDCPDCPTPPDLPPPIEPPILIAPIAFNDDYTIDKYDVTLVIIDTDGVLVNDYDPDAEPDDILILILIGDGTTIQDGTVELAEDGGFTYTPPEDKQFDDDFGTDEEGDYALFIDTFNYYIVDPDGLESSEATVTVTSKNYIPVAQPDSYDMDYNTTLSPAVDQGLIEGVVPAINGDYDPDPGDSITSYLPGALTTGPTDKGGTVTLNPDGSFTYTPSASFSGTDSFSYYVTDEFNNSESVLVTLSVASPPAVAVPFIPPAPGLQREVIETSGCPALVQWVAAELGIDESQIQISIANALATNGSIQACDACASFKEAATILQDADGTRVAALAEVINEFASSTAPPTEEQMASIADAIANDIEGNVQYAAAGEYLDALAKYVGILNSEMGLTMDQSVQFATVNYVEKLAEGENVGVAAYVAAKLVALEGSL